MSVTVNLETAYDEACRALGAATVREKFLSDEVVRLTAEVQRLSQPAEPPAPDHAI